MKRLLIPAVLAAPLVAPTAAGDTTTGYIAHLSPLGETPDWSRLDPYQRGITKPDFLHQWQSNYDGSQGTPPSPLVTILEDRVRIVKCFKRPDDVYELFFATSPGSARPSRFWRSVQELPPARSPDQPLDGLRIAIDPGHIGGDWAKMEHRWFHILFGVTGDPKEPAPATLPVKEGDVVLQVARRLEAKLVRLGAKVVLVRSQATPVTSKRPPDFLETARIAGNFPSDATFENSPALASTAERLFYLSEEIRARSRKINQTLRPDLVLCLHVNAEPWGDPEHAAFVPSNHFHLLINGNYSAGEIAFDDQRLELLLRLLQGIHPEELAMSATVAGVMAESIALPPYTYTTPNARRTPLSEYVWSRNLLATRLYACPVLFFEPYVMNHELTYTRVQAGAYEGKREILGEARVNLFEEYANAVAEGLEAYFRNHRRQFSGGPPGSQP